MVVGPAPVASEIAGATGTITLYPVASSAPSASSSGYAAVAPRPGAIVSGFACAIPPPPPPPARGAANLHLPQPGGGRPAPDPTQGGGAGDAASPLVHVCAGGLVHVGIGDDVADGEAAARGEAPGRPRGRPPACRRTG